MLEDLEWDTNLACLRLVGWLKNRQYILNNRMPQMIDAEVQLFRIEGRINSIFHNKKEPQINMLGIPRVKHQISRLMFLILVPTQTKTTTQTITCLLDLELLWRIK